MIDHVTIRVSDLAAARRFYDTVLGTLGIERSHADDELAEWEDFSLVQADPAQPDYPVTRHLHVAFVAPSRDHVDAFWEAGTAAGYADDGAPGPRPQYRDDYYGGFLRDPDGNSVEAVYTRHERKTGAIDHLWLRTRDVAAIRRFYVATGHEIGVDEPDHVQIVTPRGTISYVAGEPVTEHVHIAFGADTNEAVDAFHRAAIDAGYRDDGEPGPRPEYGPDYYGAFLLDPDGNSAEAVHHDDLPPVGAIDHLWIRVADVDAARQFYERLGIPRGSTAPGRAGFKAAGGSFSVVSGTPSEHVDMALGIGRAAPPATDPDGNRVELTA